MKPKCTCNHVVSAVPNVLLDGAQPCGEKGQTKAEQSISCIFMNVAGGFTYLHR